VVKVESCAFLTATITFIARDGLRANNIHEKS
jgi:hypothetical protein